MEDEVELLVDVEEFVDVEVFEEEEEVLVLVVDHYIKNVQYQHVYKMLVYLVMVDLI